VRRVATTTASNICLFIKSYRRFPTIGGPAKKRGGIRTTTKRPTRAGAGTQRTQTAANAHHVLRSWRECCSRLSCWPGASKLTGLSRNRRICNYHRILPRTLARMRTYHLAHSVTASGTRFTQRLYRRSAHFQHHAAINTLDAVPNSHAPFR